MAKTQMTNMELYNIGKDLSALMADHPAFRLLFTTKIDHFYSSNAMALGIMDMKMKEFIAEYVMHDDQGKPIMEEVNGKMEYKYVDYVQAKAHIDALNEFMSRSVKVES